MKNGSYHLVGVAGVGMSALAQALRAEGLDVSGSDRHHDTGSPGTVLHKLAGIGVRLCAQDGSGITPSTRAVIISTAIEEDNPDLEQARALDVRVWHRSEALAALLEGHPCIAISGTSGKSTVTGMTGWVLECLGARPTVVNGAPVINWRDATHIGNVRTPTAAPRSDRASAMGAPDDNPSWWIVEADESDRSLLNISPDWAVITNISKDHFSVEETRALFDQFRGRATKGVLSMPDQPDGVEHYVPHGGGGRFSYRGAEVSIQLPGRHNAENACCCLALCERLGYPLDAVREALARFEGIERRLERVGRARNITVVDDYAHNPAKIRASWEAMATGCPRLLAVWRPHGFGPLRSLMNDLVDLFTSIMRPTDRLFVLPVYDAGGTADRSINSDQLVHALAQHGAPAVFVPDTERIPSLLAHTAQEGDTVLTMGARDPDLPALARRILTAIRNRPAAR